MRILLTSMLVLCALVSCESKQGHKMEEFHTSFELSDSTETTTYHQAIDFYTRLAKLFPEISIQAVGETDSGHPLHMVTYNHDGDFNFQRLGKDKIVILINNGIHPGESDGIDATMMLYRDLALGKLAPPMNTTIVTIPVYNIGGALNRNSVTRVNQNGPKAYGFRGNARNYDLNRDFIKSDTKNSRTFTKIFHRVKPDIFIDTHVSNGADYQYTLTHLFTQHNKLGGKLGSYLENQMMPTLEKSLKNAGWPITPYVNVFNKPPEKGFSQFFDAPRYSTGYTTLWNTLGMMVETHMLKPYSRRVKGTYRLLQEMIAIAEKDALTIRSLRNSALTRHLNWEYYPISWQKDTATTTRLMFKGYRADTLTSEVTGLPRLRFDRGKPFTKPVIYQNHYTPADSVKIPKAYVIKRGWTEIEDLLQLNQINYSIVKQDTMLLVESYRISAYKTMKYAYEGHYPHYDTKVSRCSRKMVFSKGDLVIPTDQVGIRYLMETLEPEARDSFFNWNFFDTILQQKEGFSPYVFEDIAAEILKTDSVLRKSFLLKKDTDPKFAADWNAQLDWVYKRSAHYEPAHMQYPVYRLMYD